MYCSICYSYRYNKSETVTCREYFNMPDGTSTQLCVTGKTEKGARKSLKVKYAKIYTQGSQVKYKGYTVKIWSDTG